MIEAKAEGAPDCQGKPAFHGYYRLPTGRGWIRACNQARLPIAYTSEADAEAGARVCGEAAQGSHAE